MRAFLLSTLIALAATSLAFAQPAPSPVRLRPDAPTAISGQSRAGEVIPYVVTATVGQTLRVRMICLHDNVYFTLTAPDGQVIYDGTTAPSPDTYTGPVTQGGVYRIDVRMLPDQDAPTVAPRWVLSVALGGPDTAAR